MNRWLTKGKMQGVRKEYVSNQTCKLQQYGSVILKYILSKQKTMKPNTAKSMWAHTADEL